jgi:hypothetical protein
VLLTLYHAMLFTDTCSSSKCLKNNSCCGSGGLPANLSYKTLSLAYGMQ